MNERTAENRERSPRLAEPMTEEDAQVRELYAYYGLAKYEAQCVEHSLALLDVHAATASRHGLLRADVDRLFDRGFEQTLGRLIASVRSVIDVGPDLERQLANALRVRNWLAHDYFREKGIEFVKPEGREVMLDELNAVREELDACDAAIMALVRKFGDARGITTEKLERVLAELVRSGDDYPGSRRWRGRREKSRQRPSR